MRCSRDAFVTLPATSCKTVNRHIDLADVRICNAVTSMAVRCLCET